MNENSFRKNSSFFAQMEPYLARREIRKAMEMAEERLRKMPDDLDARVVIGRIWLMQGRVDEARDMLAEIEEILSGLSGLYACMGDLYAKKGLEKEAETFYRKASAMGWEAPPLPDGEDRRENLCEEDNVPDGKDDRLDGEEDTGISADFETVTMAGLYMKQGHLSQAEEILQKIRARDPANERAVSLSNSLRMLRAQKEQEEKNAAVISVLEKWLDNIGGIRNRAV